MLSVSPSHKKIFKTFGPIFLASILIACYWTGLHGGFFFDDEANILLADGIRLDHFSFDSIRAAVASGHSGILGRSVAQLSFALNYYFAGFNPFFFKATNLAIHAINAGLIFLITRRLFGTLLPIISRERITLSASLLATIWLLHPIQLTSVLLVVQRMTSLSALFLLTALLLHLRGRERKNINCIAHLFLAWIVCWPLSFFSKETGILFPFFVLAWELIVRRKALGHLEKFAHYLAAILGLSVLIGIGYALSSGGQWLWSGYDYRNFSLLERILTETRVLWFYLALIVAPSMETLGLYHDDFIISKTLFLPWTTLPSVAGLIGLMGLAWRLRSTAPLVSFGLAWFLIGHALESTILPLEIAHEHRNYLPLFGILLAATSALVPSVAVAGWRKTFSISLTALVLIYFPLVTFLRAQQFGDDMRRTQLEAQHHRGSARAQYEAGQILSRIALTTPKDSPIHSIARKHFEQSMALDPTFKMGALGLIYLDCMIGEPIEHRWIDELASRLKNTPFAPGDTAILHTLKEWAIKDSGCLKRTDMDTLFTAALDNSRISQIMQAKVHSWRADYLWLREHDLAAARSALTKSLTLVPANQSNRLKWAQLVLLGGEKEKAHQLLGELQRESLSPEERKTLSDLLEISQ